MDNNLTYRLTLKDFFRKTMLGAVNDTKKLDAGVNKLNSNANNLGTTLNRVAGYAAGAFAVSNLWDFTKSVVMSTAAMASFNNAIIASSRTEGEGRANLSYLNYQVDRLGLSLQAAQNGYKTFSGSVMGSNIQGAKANKVFRQVSEASTVLGLSAEQTEGSFLALGQMISKGTVSAEELRGQLAERIPGAFQIGARAMGMTTKQLGEAMKEGLIDSETFLVKFGDELEKTFGAKLNNATRSVTSNINRMGNEWERLKANIGESQSGIINNTISWVGSMLKQFNAVIGGINQMDRVFAAFGAKTSTMQEQQTFAFASSMGLKSPMQNYLDLQKTVQDKYVTPGSEGKAQSLVAEKELQQMSLALGRMLNKGKIGADEYIKSIAIISDGMQALKAGQIGGLKKEKESTGTKASAAIGSPTEISGVRPQNINIQLDRLGDVNIKVENMTEAVGQVKEMWSEGLLEVLNDANLIARR